MYSPVNFQEHVLGKQNDGCYNGQRFDDDEFTMCLDDEMSSIAGPISDNWQFSQKGKNSCS